MSKIKGFISETIIYGFANVFSRAFAMLLIPFYANYLGKIDYSNLVLLQSVFTILTFLLALNSGVFFYYYEYENVKYRKIIFTSWFYYELVLSMVFILLLFLFSASLSNFFIITNTNLTEINICILLIGLQLLPYVFNNTNINLFRINRKPKKVMIITFFEAFFTLIFVYIALYLLHFGIVGVIVGQIIARMLVAVFFCKTALFYINFMNFSLRLLKKIVGYTWPFFIISIFDWGINSMDKFIGARTLLNKSDVAILALSMQLVIPIAVLADMIRMAIGPFVMSIHKKSDAEKTYQQIFDLSLFTASIVVVLVITASPMLTLILTNKSFLSVIYIVPLMAFASLISLAANQFSISFNLVKKNTYILYAIVLAGSIGIIINFIFMKAFGIIVSGYSQIFSYLIMGLFLFVTGKRVANLKIKLKNSLILLSIIALYIGYFLMDNKRILAGNYLILIFVSIITILVISFTYLKTQKLNIKILLNYFIKQT